MHYFHRTKMYSLKSGDVKLKRGSNTIVKLIIMKHAALADYINLKILDFLCFGFFLKKKYQVKY